MSDSHLYADNTGSHPLAKRQEILVLTGKESLADFLEVLRARGTVVIEQGTEQFVVTIAHAHISNDARRLLIKGGPVDDGGLEM
ncbi:hypothetical protein [Rhizobium sp. NXC24]|uniref:hypothetical protein n=1 Tax=Rhizobium sp. NXC24 TaxID=2048897 RepID=UPI00131A54CA|nr:hypothetical protein [Rhizobium sp. NXC24]